MYSYLLNACTQLVLQPYMGCPRCCPTSGCKVINAMWNGPLESFLIAFLPLSSDGRVLGAGSASGLCQYAFGQLA